MLGAKVFQTPLSLEENCRAAAREIVNVFVVDTPRGTPALTNSIEQTIAIIIEQNMKGQRR